ncbi:MAG: response regulator [Pseudomonadota bacterium]
MLAERQDDPVVAPNLLIVEDDDIFRARLERAMSRRGYVTTSTSSIADAMDLIQIRPPAYAVVDLRLEDGSGLDVVDCLRTARPEARSVILTGYGNVPTAVAAVHAGAVDYLAKPASADEIDAALNAPRTGKPEAPTNPASPDTVKRDHIDRIFELCDGNVSETARQLGMHRRTLQRILGREREDVDIA